MKLDKILWAALAALAIGATSCSDDDDNLASLAATTVEAPTATYNSLTFSWTKVDGALQYGYELLAGATTWLTAT